MTNEELLSVAEIVERATNRLHRQAAEHEAKMVEHRAAFGVRTEADAKIIAALRAEVELANGECNVLRALTVDTAKYKANSDLFYNEQKRRMDAESERDALRAEVAALQERLRASIARGDFAQMEVARLKPQIPKHPVKVGEWVRRLVPSPSYDVGTVAKVVHVDDDTSDIQYTVTLIDGRHGDWFAKNCEPCDPPEATHAEPDLTQLHAKGKEAWSDVPNATQWVEEMRGNTEATHDTEAGKQVAEAAVKTEPVAEEIKVGDLVEVVSNRGRNTWLADVGSLGTVTGVEEINESISVHLDDVPGKKNALAGYVSLCDVRKVTT